MYLSRVVIKNFRNFKDFAVDLCGNTLIVGENRVGKSNFLHALRIVLDSDLSERARNLRFADVWDGCDINSTIPEVTIQLTFTDFAKEPGLHSVMFPHTCSKDPNTAVLTYIWRKKGTASKNLSEADFEHVIYGGSDESSLVDANFRNRVCIDVLGALRDAEQELASWKTSPLQPLMQEAVSSIPSKALDKASAAIRNATDSLLDFRPVRALERTVRDQITNFATKRQDLKASLAFLSTDAQRLFRSIGLFIDDGKRRIGEASVGSANLTLVSLRLHEYEWRRTKNDRSFSFVCVEEPEAHLHPHLQRVVFQKVLRKPEPDRAIILTTHSPTIASVAPMSSIVLIKDTVSDGSVGHSLATLGVSKAEKEDIEQYLDSSRAEILFGQGVVFVEGDAEATLLPSFASAMGIDLDEFGITVCNIGGTHFTPYVKLALCLDMPYAVITDWDLVRSKKTGKLLEPLGVQRSLDLIALFKKHHGQAALTQSATQALRGSTVKLKQTAQLHRVYLNSSTFETELLNTPTRDLILDVLLDSDLGATRKKWLHDWRKGKTPINSKQLLLMIVDVGKGRFAARLRRLGAKLVAPDYIQAALEDVSGRVRI